MKVKKPVNWEGLNIKRLKDWIVWGGEEPYNPIRPSVRPSVDESIDLDIKSEKEKDL